MLPLTAEEAKRIEVATGIPVKYADHYYGNCHPVEHGELSAFAWRIVGLLRTMRDEPNEIRWRIARAVIEEMEAALANKEELK